MEKNGTEGALSDETDEEAKANNFESNDTPDILEHPDLDISDFEKDKIKTVLLLIRYGLFMTQ